MSLGTKEIDGYEVMNDPKTPAQHVARITSDDIMINVEQSNSSTVFGLLHHVLVTDEENPFSENCVRRDYFADKFTTQDSSGKTIPQGFIHWIQNGTECIKTFPLNDQSSGAENSYTIYAVRIENCEDGDRPDIYGEADTDMTTREEKIIPSKDYEEARLNEMFFFDAENAEDMEKNSYGEYIGNTYSTIPSVIDLTSLIVPYGLRMGVKSENKEVYHINYQVQGESGTVNLGINANTYTYPSKIINKEGKEYDVRLPISCLRLFSKTVYSVIDISCVETYTPVISWNSMFRECPNLKMVNMNRKAVIETQRDIDVNARPDADFAEIFTDSPNLRVVFVKGWNDVILDAFKKKYPNIIFITTWAEAVDFMTDVMNNNVAGIKVTDLFEAEKCEYVDIDESKEGINIKGVKQGYRIRLVKGLRDFLLVNQIVPSLEMKAVDDVANGKVTDETTKRLVRTNVVEGAFAYALLEYMTNTGIYVSPDLASKTATDPNTQQTFELEVDEAVERATKFTLPDILATYIYQTECYFEGVRPLKAQMDYLMES